MTHRPRYPWVDLLKAAGILAVIWIHAFDRLDGNQAPLVARLSMLARFAVPAFFLTSGFLQAAGDRMGLQMFLARRLRRLLVPYLVASVAAILFRRVVFGESFTAGTILWMFAVGDAWGIYYFIPLLVVTSAVGEILFRFPRLAWPAWIGLTILGIMAYQLHFYAGSFAAELRNPLRWWGWFCGGWLLAVERRRIDALGLSGRLALGGMLLGVATACFAAVALWLQPGWSRSAATLEYLMVESLLIGTALVAWEGRCWSAIRWLSEASYPVYLQHYFVIAALGRLSGWGQRPLAMLLVTVVVCLTSVLLLARIPDPWGRLLFGTAAATGPSHRPPTRRRP